MPYTGRHSKKRRSGRQSFGFRVAKVIARTTQGTRTYFDEQRGFALEGSQQLVTWSTICELGDRQQIEGMIQKVDVGSIYTGIGENINAGTGSVTGYDLLHSKVDISKLKCTVHFKNIDEHPAHFAIYEVVAAKTRAFPAADIASDVIDQLHNGWVKFLPTGATSSTAKSGKLLIGSEGGKTVNTYSQFLAPHRSADFKENYRIVKMRKYKLHPGDEIFWTMRCRDRVWNPSNIYSEETVGVDTVEVIKNYSRCLLISMHGVIGRSSGLGEADINGFMQVDVSFDTLLAAKLCPLQAGKHETYHSLVHDDISGKTMVGPSDVQHVDDVN